MTSFLSPFTNPTFSTQHQAPLQTAVTTVLDEISTVPNHNNRRLMKQNTIAGGEHDLGINLDCAKRGEQGNFISVAFQNHPATKTLEY